MTSRDSEQPEKRAAQAESGRAKSAQRRPAAAKAKSRPAPAPARIAAEAVEQLQALTGRESEGVTSMERTDEGWTVQVEVLELRRVPNTTDLLGMYEVQTDQGGELQGYRRLRRYVRGAADDE